MTTSFKREESFDLGVVSLFMGCTPKEIEDQMHHVNHRLTEILGIADDAYYLKNNRIYCRIGKIDIGGEPPCTS